MEPGPPLAREKVDKTTERQPRGATGRTDSVFARVAHPGMEADSARSAAIEGVMPNFPRRHRGKPTFTTVEMQADYEAVGEKGEHWEVVSEGFGALRYGLGDKDANRYNRISEFAVFALRCFGCFEVESAQEHTGKNSTSRRNDRRLP